MSAQQLWTMIHESYGDDLDMPTDEENDHSKSSITFRIPKLDNQSNNKYDVSMIDYFFSTKIFEMLIFDNKF
jgi:hypothetical protein